MRHTLAGTPSSGRRKAPAGEDRGFCGLPVCRSVRPICIVGGHNDAANRMPPFYRNCKSFSSKLTTNWAIAPRACHPLDCQSDSLLGSHNEIAGM